MKIIRQSGLKELIICNMIFSISAVVVVVILLAVYPGRSHIPTPDAKIDAAAQKIFSDSARAQEVGPLLMRDMERMHRELDVQTQDFRQMGFLFGCCVLVSYVLNLFGLFQCRRREHDIMKDTKQTE